MTTEAIARMITQLLNARARADSICPSEVARAVAPDTWRALMPQVRAVAAELALEGTLRITQGDTAVDPAAVQACQIRGPLRLRRLISSRG
jgi:hypothetical protein